MSNSHPEGVVKPSAGGLGRLRDAVFPIYGGEETGKFLALGGIQFFIIFVLTLTRDLKDTLIITSCGAEAISFLKVCPCRQRRTPSEAGCVRTRRPSRCKPSRAHRIEIITCRCIRESIML